MAHTSGGAGRYAPPLPPRRAAGPMASGDYAVQAGPVAALRGRALEPGDYSIALMTAPPRTDGSPGVELVAPGYERQPLALQASNALQLKNANSVYFGPGLSAWPHATHAAIFNDEGELCFYGAARFFSRREKLDGIRLSLERVLVRYAGVFSPRSQH